MVELFSTVSGARGMPGPVVGPGRGGTGGRVAVAGGTVPVAVVVPGAEPTPVPAVAVGVGPSDVPGADGVAVTGGAAPGCGSSPPLSTSTPTTRSATPASATATPIVRAPSGAVREDRCRSTDPPPDDANGVPVDSATVSSAGGSPEPPSRSSNEKR